MELHFKSALFSRDNRQTSILSSFCCIFSNHKKTSSKNILITLWQISLKLHKQWGNYWMKKFPWAILEEQFPVWRNTAASKIGNGAISLLIFQNLCQWRNSSCSNLPLKNHIQPPCLKLIIIHDHTPKQKKPITDYESSQPITSQLNWQTTNNIAT